MRLENIRQEGIESRAWRWLCSVSGTISREIMRRREAELIERRSLGQWMKAITKDPCFGFSAPIGKRIAMDTTTLDMCEVWAKGWRRFPREAVYRSRSNQRCQQSSYPPYWSVEVLSSNPVYRNYIRVRGTIRRDTNPRDGWRSGLFIFRQLLQPLFLSRVRTRKHSFPECINCMASGHYRRNFNLMNRGC